MSTGFAIEIYYVSKEDNLLGQVYSGQSQCKNSVNEPLYAKGHMGGMDT